MSFFTGTELYRTSLHWHARLGENVPVPLGCDFSYVYVTHERGGKGWRRSREVCHGICEGSDRSLRRLPSSVHIRRMGAVTKKYRINITTKMTRVFIFPEIHTSYDILELWACRKWCHSVRFVKGKMEQTCCVYLSSCQEKEVVRICHDTGMFTSSQNG